MVKPKWLENTIGDQYFKRDIENTTDIRFLTTDSNKGRFLQQNDTLRQSVHHSSEDLSMVT